MSTDHDVTSPTLAAALDYARRGWRVIQLHSVGPDGHTCSCRNGGNCTSKGKHPRDTEWQKKPRASVADIHALWEERPKANVGIATGAESGIFVVDLDPKDDGIENFRLLKGTRDFPPTFTVQTGSGGYHYFFAMPTEFDVRNSQSKLAKGVDVRGSGGQVVTAPSHTDKGAYVVARDVPPAPAPDWLLDLLRPAERDETVVTAADLPRPEDIAPEEWDRLNAYARKVIDSELARLDALGKAGWDGEPWDATTFQASCALIEIANSTWNSYSLGQAEADVMSHAPRDDEGFDDWKVRQKFRSARDKVSDKARAVPQSRPTSGDDDLFAGPDVRHKDSPPPDPTGGPSSTPGGGHGGPERFFGEKDALLASRLAGAVLAEGPLGWGRDKDFWSYADGLWSPAPLEIEDRCVALLGDKFRTGHVTTVTPIIRTRSINLQGDPHGQFMNFRNGMLDWQTGELLEHDPSYLSVIQFPLDYKPEATCPTFDTFLSQVMHEDYVELAWEMLGYLMYSGNKFQVAFLLYGTGGNGKGTLTRVIQDILGMDNIANEPLDRLNGDRFSPVNLYGKIANIAGDIDATYQESTAAFKRLTGEDEIAAERKFGDRFVFRNWAVPLFSANKIPGSSDVTEGYLRRWIVLHFHKRIQNPIPGLSDLLSTEIEGIAAKAVLALRRLMERGKFDPHGEALKGKQHFAEQIDQVRQWVASGEIQAAPDHLEPLSTLYAEYSIWAQRTNRGRINETEFSHRLEAAGYLPQTIGGLIHHTGIKIPDRAHRAPASASFF